MKQETAIPDKIATLALSDTETLPIHTLHSNKLLSKQKLTWYIKIGIYEVS